MKTVTFEFQTTEKAEAFFRIFCSSDIHSKTTKGVEVILHALDVWDIHTVIDKDKNGFFITAHHD